MRQAWFGFIRMHEPSHAGPSGLQIELIVEGIELSDHIAILGMRFLMVQIAVQLSLIHISEPTRH